MDLDSFRAASEVAEGWLSEIAEARYFATDGRERLARAVLVQLNFGDVTPIKEAAGDLAAVSDGVVCWHGPVRKRCFPSAHEAVCAIRDMLWLCLAVESDAWQEVLPTIDIEILRARIRRERAKFLRDQERPGESVASLSITPPAKPKAKRGPRTTKERDEQIAEEFDRGLEAGEWDGQADYLRKKHALRWNRGSNAAKSWLSGVLKRAREDR